IPTVALGVHPSDCAAVDAPTTRLDVLDGLEPSGLGCPGHRRGRKRGSDDRARTQLGPAVSTNRAHEVVQAGMLLNLAQRRYLNRAVVTTAPEIVASEVNDHDILGTVLGAGSQGRCGGPCPLDRPGLDLRPAPREEAF